jgi:hypothetical protein
VHRLVPLVVLILIAAGCGSAEDKRAETRPATTATTPPAAKRMVVSLGPIAETVADGRSARLKGCVDDPQAEVVLRFSEHPYAGEPKVARRLKPDADGCYRTRVRPRRSTRYWAVATGPVPGRSSAALVEVALDSDLDVVAVSPTRARATITWKAKRARLQPRRGARACVYERQAGRSAWRRLRCGPAERAGGGKLVASLPFGDRSQKQGDRFLACSRLGVARGFVDLNTEGCGSRQLVPEEE